MDTFTFSLSDKDKLKRMAVIVESLEELGVLDSTRQDCYSVDKIEKSKELAEESQDIWKIGIYIYVKEKSNDGGTYQKGNSVGNSSPTSPTSRPSQSSSQSNTSHTDPVNSTSLMEGDGCATVPGVLLPGGDGASNTQSGAGKDTGHPNDDRKLPYQRKSNGSNVM